jgi:subtilisin family serine protease
LVDLQDIAFTELAVKYPEVKVAMEHSGKPMDVDNPELAKEIEAEYISLLNAAVETRTRPLIQDLIQSGFEVTTYEGMPSITVILPKSVILELEHRDDVSFIYLIEEGPHFELDSAVPNTFAPTVWARGYDGSGVNIAILEIGNVDPNNSYLNHSPISRPAFSGVEDHTTLVASCAASYDITYRGMAYNATIVSAGHDTTQADTVTALQWAFDQGSQIVNMSEGIEADDVLNWTDRAFDYWARQRFRLITKSAGNTGYYITSPGKGWNVLTVGAYDGLNDTNWAGDIIWAYSAYKNPVSIDREKPEIVAAGVRVRGLAAGNDPQTWTGTSFANSQVAGLAALLINRNYNLTVWPEASRAIIMASATHNIEGLSIITRGQGDLKDGAGAINADLADTIAQTRMLTSGPCYSSCWWGIDTNNTSFPIGSNLVRTFHVDNTTNLVRVAIVWWANADTPTNNYSFSRLDTDLDLSVYDPDGQWVTLSVSFDNNYEMVEFSAWKPGDYQIVVYKYRADEPSNHLGIALAMVPLPYRVSLPVVMRK